MTSNDGRELPKPDTNLVMQIKQDENGKLQSYVREADSMKWAGDASIPDTYGLDFSGLSFGQSKDLVKLTAQMERDMKETMSSFVGQLNVAETKDRMLQEIQDSIYRTAIPAEHFASPLPSNIRDEDEVLSIIPQHKILQRAFEVCDYEDIMANMMKKLGRQPTSNAIHRTLEFITSTTHPQSSVEYDSEDFDDMVRRTQKQDGRSQVQKEIDFLMEQLSQLIFVSKARLIMNEYPESISISVQMSPSIEEAEATVAMQAFEDVLTDFKPKGLIELEVSITNKVVY